MLAGEVALEARAGASDGSDSLFRENWGLACCSGRAGEATRSFGALGSIEITRGSSRSGNTTYTQTGNSRHDLNGRMVPSRARSVLPQTATAAAAAPMSR